MGTVVNMALTDQTHLADLLAKMGKHMQSIEVRGMSAEEWREYVYATSGSIHILENELEELTEKIAKFVEAEMRVHGITRTAFAILETAECWKKVLLSKMPKTEAGVTNSEMLVTLLNSAKIEVALEEMEKHNDKNKQTS